MYFRYTTHSLKTLLLTHLSRTKRSLEVKATVHTLVGFDYPQLQFSVVDPGFSRWGCQPLSLRRKPIIWQHFGGNCMKMKKIEPRGFHIRIKVISTIIYFKRTKSKCCSLTGGPSDLRSKKKAFRIPTARPMNKFDHVWEGPCTALFKLNRFEHVWGRPGLHGEGPSLTDR